jgi:hypothetical protein
VSEGEKSIPYKFSRFLIFTVPLTLLVYTQVREAMSGIPLPYHSRERESAGRTYQAQKSDAQINQDVFTFSILLRRCCLHKKNRQIAS